MNQNSIAGQGRLAPPPYISFTTFRSLRSWLREEGVPLRFDRSFWQVKFSGSNGTQLVAAMRFLRLLVDDSPTKALDTMVNSTIEEWRMILRVILTESYVIVPFEELPRATPAMVRQWFSNYPIDGHTLRKAISFFVNAAKEADIPMSNAVAKMAKIRSKPTSYSGIAEEARQASPTQAKTGKPSAKSIQIGQIDSPNTNRTLINLNSGGSVSLSVAVDLFQLSDTDRDFVLHLIDLIKNYPGTNIT